MWGGEEKREREMDMYVNWDWIQCEVYIGVGSLVGWLAGGSTIRSIITTQA